MIWQAVPRREGTFQDDLAKWTGLFPPVEALT